MMSYRIEDRQILPCQLVGFKRGTGMKQSWLSGLSDDNAHKAHDRRSGV